MAKFLDLVGLGKYDVKIKQYIANITGTLIKDIESISFDASKRELTVSYKNYNDASASKSVVLPLATISTAGLMSAEQVQELEDLRVDVDDLASTRLTGVKLNNVSFGVTDNVASADLSFAFSDLKDYIVLSIGNTEIGKIPTADFVKDGMLSSATVVTISESEGTTERPAGKYIKLEWNTDSGKQDPTYIAVTDLLTQISIVKGNISNGSYVNIGLTIDKSTVDGVETYTIGLNIDDEVLKSKLETWQGEIDNHETRISSLETRVGEIDDYIGTTVEPALVDVTNLKTTVGDSNSGLVKEVNNIKTELEEITNVGGEPNKLESISSDDATFTDTTVENTNSIMTINKISETEINNLF